MRIKVLVWVGLLVVGLAASGCLGSTGPQGYSGVVSSDGILYMGSADGKVVAVSPAARAQGLSFPSSDGEWSFAIMMPSKSFFSCGSSSVAANIYSTPVAANGLICVGIYDGKVMMVSPADRARDLPFPQMRSGEWIYPRGDDVIEAIVGSAVATDDSVYVCCSDGRVYALDISYGDERWSSDPLGAKLWTTPVVDGESIYVSTFDGHIYALSVANGSRLPWSFEAESGFSSSPVLYENTIFVGSFDRNLYAVRIGSDQPLWKFAGGNWFWCSPVVEEGVVYAGCLDGKVYAIDAASGKGLWSRPFDTGSPIVASPLMVGGSLVVASDSGDIHVINPTTGTGDRIRNRENDEQASIESRILAPFCEQDGIVYIRGQDNYLYSVDVARRDIKAKLSLS